MSVGAPRNAERRPLGDVTDRLVAIGVVAGHHVGGHGGDDVARRDGVDPHPLRGQLRRHRLGQADHRVLARGVGVRAQPADDPRCARCRQDRARALRHHHPRRVLRAEEHTVEQDRHGAVPPLAVGVGDRSHHPDHTCVVEHHVEATPRVDREVDGGGHVVLGGHVHPHEAGRITELLDECRTDLGLEIGHHHPRPLIHEVAGRAGTDPRGRARDHGHLSVEPTHPCPPRALRAERC